MSDELYVREIFEVSYRRLLSQLYAVTGNAAEAEDAVCEAFARAVAAGSRFRSVDNPEAWLRTVAVNIVRRQWRRSRLFRLRAAQLTASPDVRDLPDEHVTLIAAMRRLPNHHREVLALHYFGDLSVADVASTLRLPEGTVKSRLKRAREAMRDLLGDDLGGGSGEHA